MTPATPCLLFAALLSAISIAAASAQTTPKACPAPPAILTPTQPNIFSEQQEQWLGDAMADYIESESKPVQDPAENEYLTHIAKRLLAALPPTSIQFRVVLIDSPEVNGFSLAGGRVYLTRKLVANAHSEDEVASVIAHEMGHILSHQFAVETTADLKRLLGITSVGDKADIYAKFQRLVDASMKDKHPGPGGDSDEKQDEADTVAVYATAAAGYRPQAYAEFWDRMFFVKGKVGGPLSDFFGTTKPEEKRLRAILKLVNALPAGCGAAQAAASPEFEKWRTLVAANQSTSIDPDVKPVAEVDLTPPLRMNLERLRFSHDGKYILAQDESSIFVLSRDPFQLLFRFDAEDALPAEFSPDSQHIVFHTPGLHTEEWSIADRKLVASHEPVAHSECIQSKFAPDGRTLFCVSLRETEDGVLLDLAMLDAATGDVLFQKKSFFEPTFSFLLNLAFGQTSGAPVDLLQNSLSADGNILLIGPAGAKLAFDLRTRTPVALGAGLKAEIDGPYAFLGNDKIAGVVDDTRASGVFSFPGGKRIQAVPFGSADLDSVTDGNYVVSHSIDSYAVGLIDASTGKFVAASKAPAMDMWNGSLLSESADGRVVLHKLGDKTVPDQVATLPLSPLGSHLHAVPSGDGRFLALSTRTRAGIWDLRSGKCVLLSRQFNSVFFAPDNTVYAEFPKFDKDPREIVHFSSFAPVAATPVPYKEDDSAYLFSGKVDEWKPGKKSTELVVHNVQDNSVLWSQTFPGGQPAHAPNILPGTTIFSFPVKTEFAKARLKAAASLATQAAEIKNKDTGRLIQVLDDATGAVLHEVILDVPFTYAGVQGINVVGDSLYLTSQDNRTIVYALSTGTQLRQIFGYVIAADPATGHICTVNRRDEAVVYDAEDHELADYHLGSPLRFAMFQDHGGRLVLLTGDHKVRTLALSASASP